MPAGTIALTNNSTAVTGSGTNFSSELKANDFIVTVVGGVTYTLGVQSVNSATSVTLTTAYNGPTASGVAWTALPNSALVAITAQVAADVAKAIRGLNLDKANWQQVYSASGNITVTLPDGSQYSGPSWNSVASSVSGKMDKDQNLKDVADKPSARSNIGVGYTLSLANPGNGIVRLLNYDDSGLMIITRRFLVTAAGSSTTSWNYSWLNDVGQTFKTYPGVSVHGTGGYSGDWSVGTEAASSDGLAGFIKNNNTSSISIFITVMAIGVKA